MSGEQAIFNLQIKKKSGLSLNPDIHYSKVFSSALIWWISGLIFDPLLFLISRLNNACSPYYLHVIHINKLIGIKDIPF